MKLLPSPKIIAECGKPVTLNCAVPPTQRELQIKYMEWYLNSTPLCYVDVTGNITHHIHNVSDFHCEYNYGQLSLIFEKMKPLESANSVYKCKLQSNKGIDYIHTKVELQGQSTFIN